VYEDLSPGAREREGKRTAGPASIPEIARRMTEIEKKLDGTGRLLVRYSGTEPKVRVMIEGEDQNEIKALADGLAGIIREKLG